MDYNYSFLPHNEETRSELEKRSKLEIEFSQIESPHSIRHKQEKFKTSKNPREVLKVKLLSNATPQEIIQSCTQFKDWCDEQIEIAKTKSIKN